MWAPEFIHGSCNGPTEHSELDHADTQQQWSSHHERSHGHSPNAAWRPVELHFTSDLLLLLRHGLAALVTFSTSFLSTHSSREPNKSTREMAWQMAWELSLVVRSCGRHPSDAEPPSPSRSGHCSNQTHCLGWQCASDGWVTALLATFCRAHHEGASVHCTTSAAQQCWAAVSLAHPPQLPPVQLFLQFLPLGESSPLPLSFPSLSISLGALTFQGWLVFGRFADECDPDPEGRPPMRCCPGEAARCALTIFSFRSSSLVAQSCSLSSILSRARFSISTILLLK